MLILSWLQAADKLLNPFGRDKGYDVNLEEWLDSSLWRSSKTIQQQDLAAREGSLLFLDLQSTSQWDQIIYSDEFMIFLKHRSDIMKLMIKQCRHDNITMTWQKYSCIGEELGLVCY